MANVIIDDTYLSDIADAIRAKNGTNNTYTPAQMATAIGDISGGSGNNLSLPLNDIPDMALNTLLFDALDRISFGSYSLSTNNYNITINTLLRNNNIAPSGVIDCSSIILPFSIPTNDYKGAGVNFNSCFAGLKKTPQITVSNGDTIPAGFPNCFSNTNSIDNSILQKARWCFGKTSASQALTCSYMSLTTLTDQKNWDDFVMMHQYLDPGDKYLASTLSYYYSFFARFSDLTNLFIIKCNRNGATISTNMFSSSGWFGIHHLHHFTFTTNNGVPYEARWNNQVIDATYSSGIYGAGDVYSKTRAYYIANTTEYNLYGTNPDMSKNYFVQSSSSNLGIAPYNHDAMVETINSLPDTSSYGTNTIKFKSGCGSSTPAGGPENLTSAEIAVATAKGWTVSIV